MLGVQTCALPIRSEEHTSERQSHDNLVCRLLLEKRGGSWEGSGVWVRGGAQAGVVSCAPRTTLLSAAPSPRPPQYSHLSPFFFFFFFNDTATTEIYPLSLHDALPI